MRAALYLRISSDPSGEQLGVTRQREDCVKLCEAKGWEPVEYIDNDTSASNGKHRPAYEKMLTDIREGRVGAVVAWDLDRLHRRPIELEAFMALADEHHLALATVSGDVDLSTAQGRLVARLKGSVAAHEVEHKKARQRRAAIQKAEKGLPQWTRAFGYLDDTYQPDPGRCSVGEAGLRGDPRRRRRCTDICRLWNDAGAYRLNGNPWIRQQVSAFLRKPRNAGLRAHNGEIVGNGTWPALVDESTWRAAQTVLNGPGRSPGRKTVRRHVLTGVLQCGKEGCGGYLSGYWTTQKALDYTCKKCRGVECPRRARRADRHGCDRRPTGQTGCGRLCSKAEIHDEAEAEQIRVELNTLYGELEKIGVERGQRLLTGQQAKIATDLIGEDIKKLERRQQDQERLRVFDGLPLGKPEVVDAIKKLSPDRLRAVLDVLMTVTVAPVGKGGHVFNPERVQVNWR